MAAIAGGPLKAMPPWGAGLLAAVGLAYLVFGSRWPRLFDTFSATVLGCAAGLFASVWLPWPPWVAVVAGGIVLGGLAALVRNVAHGVLVAVVMGLTLACFAALVIGPEGWSSYLVVGPSEHGASVRVPGPDLSRDPVLAAWMVGLLAGGATAILRFRFSERLATSAQGGALIVLGLAQLMQRQHPALVGGYPLTVAASWVCLTAIGIAAQGAMARPEPEEQPLEPRPRRPRPDPRQSPEAQA